MRWPGASLVLLAAACPATAPCATYITKKDWNVVDPIESDRCTGRFMILASAELACTAAAECLAICADNGMPCKCDGSGPCEPGGGSLPKFETRKGLQQEYLGVEVYLKQPTACPWGAAFLFVFFVGAGLYVGGGAELGRRRGRHPVPGVPALLARHPHSAVWLSVKSLVADGVALALGGRQGRSAEQRARAPQPQEHSKHPRKPKKRRADREGEDGLSERLMEGDITAETSGAASAAAQPMERGPEPPPAAATAAGGTVAGDGGRWVKVPAT